MEVVQSGFLIVDIATVAQGVQCAKGRCEGAGDRKELAPGVVNIIHNCRAGSVADTDNVALQIGDIVVGCAVVCHHGGSTAGIVEETEGAAAFGHLAEAAAIIDVAVSHGVICPAGTHTVGIVGVCPGSRAIGHGCQFTAVAPGVRPCSVRQRIADGIIGNRHTVVLSQQIAPIRISVGVGIDCGGFARNLSPVIRVLVFFTTGNVTGIVICPNEALAQPLVISLFCYLAVK